MIPCGNYFLDSCLTKREDAPAMPKTITWRPNETDRKIIDRLSAKLGLKTSQVIKIALRRLATDETARDRFLREKVS